MNCSSLASFTMPDSITRLGELGLIGYDDNGNGKIEAREVDFYDTTSESYAFAGCTSLTSINLNKVYVIDSHAFEGCTALTTFYVGYVDLIYAYAFRGCTTAELHFDAVGAIENHAFEGCSAEQTVYVHFITEEEVEAMCYEWFGYDENYQYDIRTGTNINIVFGDMLEVEEG
jgi:hypothetical protein